MCRDHLPLIVTSKQELCPLPSCNLSSVGRSNGELNESSNTHNVHGMIRLIFRKGKYVATAPILHKSRPSGDISGANDTKMAQCLKCGQHTCLMSFEYFECRSYGLNFRVISTHHASCLLHRCVNFLLVHKGDEAAANGSNVSLGYCTLVESIGFSALYASMQI